ncbi:hypothetical protein BHMPCIPO_03752 [Ensifer sesbaniae]|nr:hypothetical protein [Ensifer sesbaniae]
MRGYPDDIVAALSETEVRTLRRVFVSNSKFRAEGSASKELQTF